MKNFNPESNAARENLIKKVGLYDPYLDILGGGEQHILSILEVLADEGCQINIFWDDNLLDQIKQRLSFSRFQSIKFLPNIFKKKQLFPLQTLLTLRTFDYFFYVTDGSYFFSSAKNNFVFAMVPNKKLYSLTALNRIKLANFNFITNSLFTQKNLKKWGIKTKVIYPYIDEKLINLDINQVKKQSIILSVGRFFGYLHSKKQEIIIKTYKKLKQNNPLFKNFRLILAGGLKEEDKEYFNQLKKYINNDPFVELKPNISLDELYKLYKLSTFFWHFTGFGEDENKHPERVEHLGIAPLQAMASGCLTFCYQAGGPKEIIKDGKNGFLFSNEKELFQKMHQLITNYKQQYWVQKNAKEFIKKQFSYNVFKINVKKILKL